MLVTIVPYIDSLKNENAKCYDNDDAMHDSESLVYHVSQGNNGRKI